MELVATVSTSEFSSMSFVNSLPPSSGPFSCMHLVMQAALCQDVMLKSVECLEQGISRSADLHHYPHSMPNIVESEESVPQIDSGGLNT